MAAPNAISPDKLFRLIGTARTPVILDVRSDEDFAADPRLLPGAMRADDRTPGEAPWPPGPTVVLCQAGHQRSQGAAGLLGLSRIHADDQQQMEAGMLVHDALYRWARDATGETHNWPAARTRAAP
ncbi:hypothetical protein [Paracoccus fontiphilus]|uniref:hypothetical protein n=1 Tax=Paracoccus fontiphilus TaxID=1815556 RepID=UPI001A96A24F|nr:hypothetical protein [Paracoccus fontiphilus]